MTNANTIAHDTIGSRASDKMLSGGYTLFPQYHDLPRGPRASAANTIFDLPSNATLSLADPLEPDNTYTGGHGETTIQKFISNRATISQAVTDAIATLNHLTYASAVMRQLIRMLHLRATPDMHMQSQLAAAITRTHTSKSGLKPIVTQINFADRSALYFTIYSDETHIIHYNPQKQFVSRIVLDDRTHINRSYHDRLLSRYLEV